MNRDKESRKMDGGDKERRPLIEGTEIYEFSKIEPLQGLYLTIKVTIAQSATLG